MASILDTPNTKTQTEDPTALLGQPDIDVLRYGCSAEAAATEATGNEDIILSIYSAAMNGRLARTIPSILWTMGDELERRIREWYEIFQRSGLVAEEDEAACSLQMLYHVTLVSIAVRMSPTQTAFDDFTPHFHEIIRLAEIYNRLIAREETVFTLEVGALAPLWSVNSYT